MDVRLFCRTVGIGAAIFAFVGIALQLTAVVVAALALGVFALLVDLVIGRFQR